MICNSDISYKLEQKMWHEIQFSQYKGWVRPMPKKPLKKLKKNIKRNLLENRKRILFINYDCLVKNLPRETLVRKKESTQ